MKLPAKFLHELSRPGVGIALALWSAGLTAQEAVTNAPAPPVEAPAATAPTRHEYGHFSSINDRNIFNPNRSKRTRYNATEEKPPEPKIDVVGLTGTLSYQKGSVAFFDSTAGEFRKAARVGEQIAGYTLRDIAPNSVSLEREGQPLQLKVGQQLRRQDEGPWEVTTGEPISTSAAGRSSRSSRRDGGESSPSNRSSRGAADESGTTTSTAPAAGGAPGEGPSEALKRLLEQRRKEQAQ